ncbi:MAG TPA: acetate kinase, partial [Bacteroidota bacterium]
ALVFTGGIGENSPAIRKRICTGLEWLGISIDDTLNASAVGKEVEITKSGGKLRVFVIPTNEELLIARDTVRSIKDAPRRW